MTPPELYKAGKLQEAIDAQIQVVKASPADHAKRLFLFELVAFSGDLDRAKRQIEAVQYAEMEIDAAVQAYRKLVEAEQFRRKVFADGVMPQFLTTPPAHLGKRLEAVTALRNKDAGEAAKILAEADAAAPKIAGLLNGKPFTSLRDGDDLLGPTLEIMAHGDYYWIPLEQVETLSMVAPRFPRDLIWFPAKLAVKDGPAGDVFIPALYHGSHANADDQVKLGRVTDWVGDEGAPVRGIGSRVFLVNDDARPMLDWRELQVLTQPVP